MNRDLPPPAECFFQRETCIVEPSLVEELGRAIRQTRPRQRGDFVDHQPKLVFRSLQTVECLVRCRSRPGLPPNIGSCANRFAYHFSRRITRHMDVLPQLTCNNYRRIVIEVRLFAKYSFGADGPSSLEFGAALRPVAFS